MVAWEYAEEDVGIVPGAPAVGAGGGGGGGGGGTSSETVGGGGKVPW